MTKNHWDERFSSEEYIYGREANDFIEQMNEFIPAHSVVACLAEGEGRNAVFLAQRGHKITTYDQSEVGLGKTRQLAEQNNVKVETVLMDLTKERVPKEEYDAAILVFGHVSKKNQPYLIQNLLGSVKLGGHVIFEVYSEEQINYKTGGPNYVDALYNPATILDLVNDHKVLHFYYGEAERHEGKNHTGLCHVIQVVLQKV